VEAGAAKLEGAPMLIALQWISVFTAFVAAALWFLSAEVRIRPWYPFGLRYKQVQDLSDAIRKQSDLSAWAAIFAGTSAFAQAVAMILTR
jgi:hypothetical protein